jgi:FkbM family methyltransferase
MALPMRIAFKILDRIESTAAYLRGKNYGATTIQKEVNCCLKLLRRKPRLAVDIGGNKGDYTAELLKVSSSTEVHVFEPSALNVRVLHDRFSAHETIHIVPAAVSSTAGAGILYSDTPGSGLASLTNRDLSHFKHIAFRQQEQIETIRFDAYWRDHLAGRPVDLMKIDVEGEEFNVLKGVGDAISAIGLVQFEIGGANIDTRVFFRDFWNYFQTNNFQVFRISPLGLEEIKKYRESNEHFQISNYIALNRRPVVS